MELQQLVALSIYDVRRLLGCRHRDQGFDHDDHMLRYRDADPQFILGVAARLDTHDIGRERAQWSEDRELR